MARPRTEPVFSQVASSSAVAPAVAVAAAAKEAHPRTEPICTQAAPATAKLRPPPLREAGYGLAQDTAVGGGSGVEGPSPLPAYEVTAASLARLRACRSVSEGGESPRLGGGNGLMPANPLSTVLQSAPRAPSTPGCSPPGSGTSNGYSPPGYSPSGYSNGYSPPGTSNGYSPPGCDPPVLPWTPGGDGQQLQQACGQEDQAGGQADQACGQEDLTDGQADLDLAGRREDPADQADLAGGRADLAVLEAELAEVSQLVEALLQDQDQDEAEPGSPPSPL